MLLEIPILYAARVVPAGKRAPIEALVQCTTPVRVDDADLPVAARLLRQDRSGAVEDLWYDGGDRPVLPLASILRTLPFRDGTGSFASSPGEVMAHLCDPGLKTVTDPHGGERRGWRLDHSFMDGMPFLSREATDRGEDHPDNPDFDHPSLPFLPIYRESEDLRSIEPIREDLRNIAIAHAQHVARGVVMHAGTGDLLVPSAGPVVQADGNEMRIVPHQRLAWMSHHVYRGEDLDEAIAFFMDMHRGMPARPPQARLEIMRPGLSRWDASGASIATAAGHAGMRRRRNGLQTEQRRVMGLHDSGNSNHPPGIASVFHSRQHLRPLFRDTRDPSPGTVAIAREVVGEVVDAVRRAFVSGSGHFVDTNRVWALDHLCSRAGHAMSLRGDPATPPAVTTPKPGA